jgi:hypothetical protein
MEMAILQEINQTPAQPNRPEITDEEGAAMARAIVNLFAQWDLTDEQARTLLGSISLSTWARWKKGTIGNVPRDLKARLSNLMGIHKALRIIFKDKERVYGWVKRENEAFGGASALNIMMGGEMTDLMRVRHYLDAERGAW